MNETRRHVIITQNGDPKAVLQDPASFEEMRPALTLMKMISQSEKAIREGKVVDNEAVFRDLEERLKDQGKGLKDHESLYKIHYSPPFLPRVAH